MAYSGQNELCTINNWEHLTRQVNFIIMFSANGVWRSLVSRLVRVQEASGSNPDTPTKKNRAAFAALFFLVLSGFERPLRKHAGGMFLGRGRILCFPDAPQAGVDGKQICSFSKTPYFLSPQGIRKD